MGRSTNAADLMTIVARVLIWCFTIGILFVAGWFGCFMLFRDVGYEIHASIFGVSRHEFDMMHFYGMTFVKVCMFWCFLVPYVAVRVAKASLTDGTG